MGTSKPQFLLLGILVTCLIVTQISAKYEYQVKYLDVPLDHFTYVNESVTFKMRLDRLLTSG